MLQTDDPGPEYSPAGQGVHVAADVAPNDPENIPPEQFRHPVPPGPAYEPASHTHAELPEDNENLYPALHTQSPICVLPSSECVWLGHSSHVIMLI